MSWYKEVANKVLHLSRRNGFDESLDEEVRLHLETRTEELIASGLAPRDAMAQARREFGSTARISEQARDAWRWTWLEDLMRDLRHAARTLAADKAFAATAVTSLALGIGVNTTIFSLTSEFLFSQPSVRDPDMLVRAEIGGSSHAPMREYRFIRDANVFAGLAGVNELQEVNWRSGEISSRLFVTRVTENFFEVTGMPVALGRAFGRGEGQVAVISHKFWQGRLNGDPGVLGRAITLDNRPHTIVGVLPSVHRTLTGFGYVPDMYLPVASDATYVALFGRVPADVSRAGLFGRLRSAAAQLDQVYPDGNHKWAADLSISEMVGVERLRRGFLRSISAFFLLLMAVVALLLLIACANVASLLLARGSARAQEFAIRMSIGAGRSRLIRQMLAESLLLAVTGTAAGLALNYGLTRMFNRAILPMPFPVALAIQPDFRLLIYSVIVAILTALLAGLLPAFKSTRTGTNALLKRDEHQVSGYRATLRNSLVTGQIAISVLVLIMAALSVRNLIESSRLDPGFDLRRTVWAQMRLVPENYPNSVKVRAAVASTLERIRGLAAVEDAAIVTFVPLNDHFASRSFRFYTDEVPQGKRIEHSWNAVGPGYFSTMGIEILAGRQFEAQDRAGSARVTILNESFVKQVFGNSNPVGRRIRQDATDLTVVGVARNSKYSTIGERDRAAMYQPYFQVGGSRATLQILVKAKGSPEALLRPLNAALLEADPSSSVDVKPMSSATAFALLPSRAGAALLGSIGLLGLVLASVGLYGVLAYSITRRTREIGLRMALGAQSPQVLKLVLREGAWILGTGLVTGSFVAFFVTKPLAIFLVPGLRASDPVTYAMVALVLILVGSAATLTPTLRALRIDPISALRHE